MGGSHSSVAQDLSFLNVMMFVVGKLLYAGSYFSDRILNIVPSSTA
jgi:hypothetical protein